jgi:hypothetical protein
MFGLGRQWPRRTAQIAAVGMLAASGSMFVASTALAAPAAGGNNGTVKLGSGGAFTNSNDPHLSCPIQIQWSGFDPGVQTYDVAITTTAPTGGTVTVGGDPVHDTFSVQPATRTFTLSFGGGANPNNKGEFHVNITVNTTSSTGSSDVKHKTIWAGNCAAAPSGGAVSMSGACTTNTFGSGYTWNVTATPAAPGGGSDVTGTWSGGGNNGVWSTTAGAGSFTTPSASNAITVALDAAFTGAGWTITQPAAGPTPCGAAPTDPTASAVANCTTLTAHLDGGTSGATFHIVEPGGTHDVPVAGGATQDETYAPSAGAEITVTLGGVQKAHAKASNSCGGPPTDPSATVNADCTALTAHLDGGTSGTTFTINEPGGTHSETVAGGSTKDVSYGSGNGATISVSNGATLLGSANAPADCVGSAAPTVAEANHCKSGMNLTLSNLSGTADVTFTVTDPDGNTQQVGVRAGQLKKVAFAVTEDTTGTLSVSAPGLAKKTFTYKKNCATVLGVKHTRKPPTKTHHKPVVEGEHAQLPFTGFDTRRALLDGAGLFFFGAVLCMLGARRKDEDYIY